MWWSEWFEVRGRFFVGFSVSFFSFVVFGRFCRYVRCRDFCIVFLEVFFSIVLFFFRDGGSIEVRDKCFYIDFFFVVVSVCRGR